MADIRKMFEELGQAAADFSATAFYQVNNATRERSLAEGGVISLPQIEEVKIEEISLLPFEKEARPAARLPNLLVRVITK